MVESLVKCVPEPRSYESGAIKDNVLTFANITMTFKKGTSASHHGT